MSKQCANCGSGIGPFRYDPDAKARLCKPVLTGVEPKDQPAVRANTTRLCNARRDKRFGS